MTSAITEVALERQCFGCDGAGKYVFRRDGTGTWLRFGSHRQGTPDSAFQGTIPQPEFERLARLLASEGFFDLRDAYRDPELQDGRSVTTSAVRGTERKVVVNNNGAGPPNLDRIETAIGTLIDKTQWKPTLAR